MTTYKIVLVILIAFGVGGCVTAPPYGSGAQDMVGRPRTVMLVQAPMAVNQKLFHDLFAPDLEKDSPESRHTVNNAVEAAQARALTYMQSAVESQTGIKIIGSEGVTRGIASHR